MNILTPSWGPWGRNSFRCLCLVGREQCGIHWVFAIGGMPSLISPGLKGQRRVHWQTKACFHHQMLPAVLIMLLCKRECFCTRRRKKKCMSLHQWWEDSHRVIIQPIRRQGQEQTDKVRRSALAIDTQTWLHSNFYSNKQQDRETAGRGWKFTFFDQVSLTSNLFWSSIYTSNSFTLEFRVHSTKDSDLGITETILQMRKLSPKGITNVTKAVQLGASQVVQW